MPIVIPQGFSTYRDSTPTEGGKFSKYVLAQFRDDGNFAWVQDTRSFLALPELKYEGLRGSRGKLKTNKPLWAEIERGIGQASVIIIDPEPHRVAVAKRFDAEGREEGVDFDENDLIKGCAVAVLRNTPIAYLPLNLAYMMPSINGDIIATLDRFTPKYLQSKSVLDCVPRKCWPQELTPLGMYPRPRKMSLVSMTRFAPLLRRSFSRRSS